MGAPTRDNFVEQVIEIIRSRFPLVKVARSPLQSFTILINGAPTGLENLYRMSMLRPEDTRRQVERWVVELLRAAEGSPDRGGSFEELKERILPMVVSNAPRDVSGTPTIPESLVTQSIVHKLNVAYAVDNDRTISYIPRPQFEKWHITMDELHDTAVDNLIKRSQTMQAHAAKDDADHVTLMLFQSMDGYDASRILLPALHDRLKEHLGSPFAAGIPNRDILLCFRHDPALIRRLREQIQTDYLSMPHQITDALFLVTPDGIAPLEDETAGPPNLTPPTPDDDEE
jgi:hypothetical protein